MYTYFLSRSFLMPLLPSYFLTRISYDCFAPLIIDNRYYSTEIVIKAAFFSFWMFSEIDRNLIIPFIFSERIVSSVIYTEVIFMTLSSAFHMLVIVSFFFLPFSQLLKSFFSDRKVILKWNSMQQL